MSPLKVGFADFSKATSLQSIVVGSNASGYTNLNLKELNIGTNNFLKLVDARNCTALTGSIDLSGASNIEHVYFDGTAISAVNLPVGGVLKTLSLPSTITNLTIRNQNAITTFRVANNDYSNISTLRIENSSSVIPMLTILSSLEGGSRVRIIGFTMSVTSQDQVEEFYAYLDTMKGVDESGNEVDKAVVSGTITGLGTITGAWLAEMNARYPDITIEFEHITSILSYYTYDGGTLLYTETISDGGDGTYDGRPTRQADARYTYTFAGWTTTPNASAEPNALIHVTADRSVYAAYEAEGQKYTVYFYNNDGNGGTGTLLQTVNNVLYDGTAVYTGETPKHPSDPDNFEFSGWSPSNERITGNTGCIAQYRDLRSPVIQYLSGTLEEYTSDTNEIVGDYAFYGMTRLKKIVAPITTFGNSCLSECKNLEYIDLINSKKSHFPNYFLSGNHKIHTLIIRSNEVTTLQNASVFIQTVISGGRGGIYVPSNLVDSYKNNSNWSIYSDYIYPIDSYPVIEFSTIKDSWDEIIESIDNNTYSSKYKIGDTKVININGYNIDFQIVGFNKDVLEDGETTVPISFIAKQTFLENTSGEYKSPRWDESEIRNKLNSEIFAYLPDNIAQRIQPVQKTSAIRDDSNNVETITTIDKLWLPSYREIRGVNDDRISYFENSGCTYQDETNLFGIFNINVSKYCISAKEVLGWWLRSADSKDYRDYITYSGQRPSGHGSSDHFPIAIGFCLG